MKQVFLGLGSNLGKKKANLDKAIALLQENEAIEIKKVSSYMNFEALAKDKQPNYLNAAVELETELTPMELLQFTKDVEKQLGRKDKGKNKPRPIDIDILFYGKDIVCLKGLTIPHPLIHERLFVLATLKEIAPRFIHPVLQESVQKMIVNLINNNEKSSN
jgi:2-amino-4-hydroxy-6-hydroxymethyldihydropteridine diphosphokinase